MPFAHLLEAAAQQPATTRRLLIVIAALALLLRASVSMWGYSGAGRPPMYGDYEAQRHWMEVTLHVPIADWYRNTTDNDLQYWGIDYPPLQAYTSWFFGRWSAAVVGPESVALHDSRGFESPLHKAFMRATVLVCDVLVLVPAAAYFAHAMYGRDRSPVARARVLAAFSALVLSPPLILVDSGHFQYNGAALGMALAGAAAVLDARPLLGALLYTLSLNHKQMGLYFAPAFFFYLLGQALQRNRTWPRRAAAVARLGAVVVGTFVVLWAPWLLRGRAADVVIRLFPRARGLYEDKVASVWCVLAPVFDLRRFVSQSLQMAVCAAATLVAMSVSCIDLLRHPTRMRFCHALVTTSLSFFLFSYQVHEKTLLYPLLAVVALTPVMPFAAALLALVGSFSMFPLLLKDGLAVPYAALTAVHFVLVAEPLARRAAQHASAELVHAEAVVAAAEARGTPTQAPTPLIPLAWAHALRTTLAVYPLCVWHVAHAFITPPARYPDLLSLFNSAISVAFLLPALALYTLRQLRLPREEVHEKRA